jgi:sugar diacid utilization regulator
LNLRELTRTLTEELDARYPVPGDPKAQVTGLAIDEGSGDWLGNKDVVITAREALSPEFLERVSANGSPAILWRTHSRPPEGVVEELRELGLGLLTVSPEFPVGRIYNALYEPDEILLYSHRVARELLESTGGSVEGLVARISEFLGRPVLVEDSVGRVLVSGGESGELSGFLEERGIQASKPAGIEDIHRERRDRYARLPQGFLSVPVERWRVEGREISWTPIGGRAPAGYLWFAAGEDLTARDVVALYWAVRVLEAELGKERIRLETELSIRGDFVDDLIHDRYGSVDLMLQRARYLGADLSRGAMALIVDIDDFARYLERRKMKEPAIQELKRRLADAAHLQTRELFENYLLGPRSDNVILFLAPAEGMPPEALAEAASKLAGRIQTYVKGLLPDLTVSIGTGRYTADPDHLPEAYSEAEVALEIGRRILGPSSFSTFESTGTYKLLYRVLKDEPAELETFYRETVEPLVAYDSRYGTELITTLATYLKNDASMAKTAAELFAHRHTIRYRLERIRDLTGLNVDRSEDRERITLGIKSMQLLGHAPQEPARFTDR